MDEFLYLDGMNLLQFSQSEQLQNYRDDFLECSFKWVMSPLCNNLYANSVHDILQKKYFFPSGQFKTMYYSKDIHIIGEHKSKLKSKNIVQKRYDPQEDNIFIFHVSSRGVMDIINKIQFGKFNDLKETQLPQKELNELIFDSQSIFLPARFALLAFQNRFNDYLIKIDFKYPVFKYKTDVALLKEITLNGLTNLLDKKVFEEDLERFIYRKMNNYDFSSDLVEMYAKGNSCLMDALKYVHGTNPLDTTKKSYTYDEFLIYDDRDFINAAINSILKRKVKDKKFKKYLLFLQKEEKTKNEILTIIRYSRLGVKANIKLHGSKKRYLLLLLSKLPFFGLIIKDSKIWSRLF